MPKINKEVIREQYPILYNETPSLTDSVYHDQNDPFRYLNENEQVAVQTNKVVTRAIAAKGNTVQLQPLPSTSEIVQKYRQSISEHISRRINSLFLQLICCYKTEYQFEIGDTLAQGASVVRLELSGIDDTGKSTNIFIQRNAAHSSTIPCLVSSKGKQKKFFLVGTDAFRIWNATINMPASINKVDTKIDGDSKGDKLRTKTLDIINKVAQKNINPVEGLIEFMSCIRSVVDHLYKIEVNPSHREILSMYKMEIKTILEEQCDISFRIESLLGTTVFDSSLRAVIYEIRYDAIRRAQFYQEELIEKVNNVKELILTEILTTAKRKPDNFEGAFRTLLIEQIPTDDDYEENRKRIEKMYNFSPFDFELRLTSGNLTKYKKSKQILTEKYRKHIQTLGKQLCVSMKEFRKQEREKVGKVVKLLRKAKHWKKEEFAEQIPMNLKELSEIENKRKIVNPLNIKKFARVFEVSDNLFTSDEFFYE